MGEKDQGARPGPPLAMSVGRAATEGRGQRLGRKAELPALRQNLLLSCKHRPLTRNPLLVDFIAVIMILAGNFSDLV